MKQPMRLLFATSLVPDGRLSSGFEIATAAVIGSLRRVGADVTVLGFGWPDGGTPTEDTRLLGRLDPRTEGAPLAQKLNWLSQAMRAGLPFSAAKLRMVSPESVAAAIRRAGPVDAYVLNSIQFAAAFEAELQDRPSLYVAHNVEHRSAAENAAAAASPIARALFRREARVLEAVEDRICRRAAHVFALADDDRAVLGLDDERSSTLPLVTRPHAPPAPPDRAIRCDAALIGTWSWASNRIGLDWFLDRVAPLLPPDFRVEIAGSVPAGRTSAHPGIRFVGRVPDAAAFVRSAAVVPLVARAGTGVQLKTIETFELGLPAVATPRSLRGVSQVPSNCVVADEPDAFAAALIDTARRREPLADGAAFHRTQRDALDRAVALGLAAATGSPRRKAAA